MTAPPSPAAQAVDTALAACIQLQGEIIRARHLAAVAIRAAADRVVPEQKPWHRTTDVPATRHLVRTELLAIAAELDSTNPINQEDTMSEFEKLPNGFYWISSKSHPSERSLVRLYTNPDTAQRGIGFGVWDGCVFIPLSDLTQDTVLVPWSENNTSEGNQ